MQAGRLQEGPGPKEKLITFCENQGSVVRGWGLQLDCAVLSLSHVQLFATSWTLARQAPLSVGFPRQEYWSGLPFPSPGGLSHPGREPASLLFPAFVGEFFTTSGIIDVQILALTVS